MTAVHDTDRHRATLNFYGSARRSGDAARQSDDRLQRLIVLADSLTECDFRPALDGAATQIGAAAPESYALDGQFHRLRGASPADQHRVGYVGNWCCSKAGVRYPRATFHTHRHGGRAVLIDGYLLVRDLFERGALPAPVPTARPAPTAPDPAAEGRARASLNRLWAASVTLDAEAAEPARRYHAVRGLGELIDRRDLPHDLRFHSALPYWITGDDGRPQRIAELPALLALVRALDGSPVGLHQTYLRTDGAGKAALLDGAGNPLPARKLRLIAPGAGHGAAVRLFEAGDRLAIGEGIETALAVRCADPTLSVWAALSAGALAAVALPDAVRDTLLLADHDPAGAGQRAAVRLARRLRAEGRAVRIALPVEAGTDFADVLGTEVPA